MALNIKSSLETAISNKFVRNQFHHALYRWNVLADESIANPGIWCDLIYVSTVGDGVGAV